MAKLYILFLKKNGKRVKDRYTYVGSSDPMKSSPKVKL